MQKFTLILAIVISTSPFTFGSLPSWLKVCKSSHPDYEKCTIDSAKAVIPEIMKGDKTYGIPKLNPLSLPFVNLQAADLTLNFTNAVVSGLEQAKLNKFNYDYDKDIINAIIDLPILDFKGHYRADGKVLVLSITGEGAGHIVFHSILVNAKIFLKAKEKQGKKFIEPEQVKLVLKIKKVDFEFENLFNGNKELGSEMNKFMNENWEIMINDFRTSIENIVAAVIKVASEGILKSVPLDEIFPK